MKMSIFIIMFACSILLVTSAISAEAASGYYMGNQEIERDLKAAKIFLNGAKKSLPGGYYSTVLDSLKKAKDCIKSARNRVTTSLESGKANETQTNVLKRAKILLDKILDHHLIHAKEQADNKNAELCAHWITKSINKVKRLLDDVLVY